MRIGSFLAALFGILLVLAGAVLIAGAITLFTADQDADDFFVSEPDRLETASFAITSDIDVLDDAPAWVVDWFRGVADVRMTATSSTGGAIFMGLADAGDVDTYLDGVAHDEVISLDVGRSVVDYRSHEGATSPALPGAQTFWAASAEGLATQTMDWAVESGTWSVVVMDPDAERGVSADIVFGGRIENITIFMWIALGVGIVLGFVGLAMLFMGIRSPRSREIPPPAAATTAGQ